MAKSVLICGSPQFKQLTTRVKQTFQQVSTNQAPVVTFSDGQFNHLVQRYFQQMNYPHVTIVHPQDTQVAPIPLPPGWQRQAIATQQLQAVDLWPANWLQTLHQAVIVWSPLMDNQLDLKTLTLVIQLVQQQCPVTLFTVINNRLSRQRVKNWADLEAILNNFTDAQIWESYQQVKPLAISNQVQLTPYDSPQIETMLHAFDTPS